jgi:hypothetical protein
MMTQGLNVVITATSGEKFEGLLSGSSLSAANPKMTLKMVKRIQPVQANGIATREAALIGTSPEFAMSFDFRDVADMSIPEFTLPESSKAANGMSLVCHPLINSNYSRLLFRVSDRCGHFWQSTSWRAHFAALGA